MSSPASSGPTGWARPRLLRVILGLQRPDSGEVRVLGAPLLAGTGARSATSPRRWPSTRTSRSGPGTWSRSGSTATGSASAGAPAHQRQLVEEMLRGVDAEQFADSRVGSLSGGEQQRVLIAHALISRPKLLLLDEPLANLDPKSVQEIVSLLHRVATDHDVAILLSAHEMNALLPVMDRIVYVADGRAASGTTEEVVRSEVLSKLYGHHVDVLKLHGRVLVVAEPGAEAGDIPDHPTLTVS